MTSDPTTQRSSQRLHLNHVLRPGVVGLAAVALLLGGCVQQLSVGALDPVRDDEQPSPKSPAPESDSDSTREPEPTPDDPSKSPENSADKSEESDPGPDSGSPKPDKVDCELPEPNSCDDLPCNCLSYALGVGCPGNATDLSNPETASYTNYPQTKLSWLSYDLPEAYAPTEGQRAVILGTGPLEHFMQKPEELAQAGQCSPERPRADEYEDHRTCPSQDTPERTADHIPPRPIVLSAVDPSGKVTCKEDPALVGQGDCSNSLQALVKKRSCWEKDAPGCDTQAVHDASAFSIQITVPSGASTLAFDSAFLSAEYPFNYQSPDRVATDAFVVWLRSKQWTGNVLMDDAGQAMTVDNAWLTLKDAPNLTQDCPAPCTAPQLHEFSMQGHAATPWLTTTFPVKPGERIMLTFAVMEFGSPLLDSYALIDNLRWGCDRDIKAPITRLAQ